jgi:quinol monooxygenase YgiN
MSVVTVVAKLVVRKDAVETVKAELFKLIEPTRQEAGCIEYRLHQDNDDPKVFIFYENWQSMASLERHITSNHFQAYVAAVDGMIEEKSVRKMSCIA